MDKNDNMKKTIAAASKVGAHDGPTRLNKIRRKVRMREARRSFRK